MHVHRVFVAGYRRKIPDPDATGKLHSDFTSAGADFDAELAEMDGESGHVHLLINYPPKLAVSNLVNSLKGGLAGCFAVTGQLSPEAVTREAFCGQRVILQAVAVVRRYRSSGSTLDSSKHQVSQKTAPSIPALKDGVLRRT